MRLPARYQKAVALSKFRQIVRSITVFRRGSMRLISELEL
jgi:hypothetical protein